MKKNYKMLIQVLLILPPPPPLESGKDYRYDNIVMESKQRKFS